MQAQRLGVGGRDIIENAVFSSLALGANLANLPAYLQRTVSSGPVQRPRLGSLQTQPPFRGRAGPPNQSRQKSFAHCASHVFDKNWLGLLLPVLAVLL
jgi:hypothetical protein